jgi:hypothetical protein
MEKALPTSLLSTILERVDLDQLDLFYTVRRDHVF